MKIVLYLSGAFLALAVLLAAIYEAYAGITGREPYISDIIIPWVKTHNLWASLIVGGVVGFLTFLIVHFFGAR